MVAASTLLWTSAKPIIKFICMGGCGAIMAKHGLLSPAGSKVVAGLILNYTLPALLFAKMLACVTNENAVELGYVAVVAVMYIVFGAIMGFLIQRTGLVPKRLYRGIIAATMFTNFGDLPISIILAVSDHPPFLVGDGARGTAYSSVFIAVFYIFLFPLGGYRLIRYDHVKESKRLGSLTDAIANGGVNGASTTMGASYIQHPDNNNSLTNLSEATLCGDTLTSHPDPSQRCQYQQEQQQQNPRPFTQPQQPRQQLGGKGSSPQGAPQSSSFSATSTMISVDYTMEDGGKEMRYRPHDEHHHHPYDSQQGSTSSASQSPAFSHSSPFILGEPSPPLLSSSPQSSSMSTHPSPATFVEGFRRNPFLPQHPLDQPEHGPYSGTRPSFPTVQALRSEGQHGPRFSVESFASNGTGTTRHHGHGHGGSTVESDDHELIMRSAQSNGDPARGNGGQSEYQGGGMLTKSRSMRSPLFKNYQPPAFLTRRPSGQALGYSEFDNGQESEDANGGSISPYISLTPPEGSSSSGSSTRTGSPNNKQQSFASDELSNIPLEPIVTVTPPPAAATANGAATIEPLPKVPPALARSYQSKKTLQSVTSSSAGSPPSSWKEYIVLGWHWFWRIFHSVREYLTPPTIGLILGLIVALTPHLRILFVLPTPGSNLAPAPSFDELPPLSFIYEITLLLGGCCVPLGLTVLGASLSRLKPGRMRPLIPTLTMITFVKLFLSPALGILFMQTVLIRTWGWVDAKNHMLQFTLMLMSGSPTSITCFVLAQVWDRRTVNAGGEMAAVIAVQYAVACVAMTLMSAGMMFYLF
ncbi:auxin efflux carrier family protein [Entomortierella parvispora]|uniref:Auxin efflux carrier family protein n=1 Tax=Entomortierella parvispora TaxID=205924 RepID=A0A9P3M1D4_9FUNG|nr:auxin efflux carrier family protein [Entomortierella parvispora]